MTTRSNSVVSVWGAAACAVGLLTAAPASAADWTFRPFEFPQTYTADFGARFWYGQGTTSKDLYGSNGNLVSRLTYGKFQIDSLEAFGRFDIDGGWTVKGYAGGGGFRAGNLKDEDFPPAINPYSATLSVQSDGAPAYVDIDAGYKFLRGADFHVGAFAGYHWLNETGTAWGCTQVAANPNVCGNIPATIKVISQVNNWHALRVGAEAAVEFNRFKLSAEAAWLPYVALHGSDAHWLRIGISPGDFRGPIPEDGTGWGYQLEGIASYQVTEVFSVGVGGRYWHMETKGDAHFENLIVAGVGAPQPVNWKLDNFGVFVQGSMKLGPYSVISHN